MLDRSKAVGLASVAPAHDTKEAQQSRTRAVSADLSWMSLGMV